MQEASGETFIETLERVAPKSGPVQIVDKLQATFFIPTLLVEAELVGKTREAALRRRLPTIGKARCGNCVTTSNMAIFDLDGIPEEQLMKILKRLEDSGISYAYYTSHSHGRPDKVGWRVRFILPLDGPVNKVGYKQLIRAMNKLFFEGLADVTGSTLAQQQGIWATAPERVHLARRLVHEAGVLSTSAILASLPPMPPKKLSSTQYASNPSFDEHRVEAAVSWFDLSNYQTWFDIALWLKAGYGDVARGIWFARSNFDVEPSDKYHPARFWEEIEPQMPAEAAVGLLFGGAKDRVVALIKERSKTGDWSGEGKRALVYLKNNHRAAYAGLFGEVM
jgi:hypothetical protein